MDALISWEDVKGTDVTSVSGITPVPKPAIQISLQCTVDEATTTVCKGRKDRHALTSSSVLELAASGGSRGDLKQETRRPQH